MDTFNIWKRIVGFQIGDTFELRITENSILWRKVKVVSKEPNGFVRLQQEGNGSFYIRLEELLKQHPECIRGRIEDDKEKYCQETHG